MTCVRFRSLLAATAVAAVLSSGLTGHALPQMSGHDGMAGAAAGLCLLLASALTFVALPTPEAHDLVLLKDAAPSYVAPQPRALQDARTRASPSALQRFRN